MDDRNTERRTLTDSDSERDVLAELIQAAGRRPSPRLEDYNEVLSASREAWQTKVKSRKRRQWTYALAASVAVAAIGISLIVQMGPREPLAFAAVVQGQVEMMPPGTRTWQIVTVTDVGLMPGTRLRTHSGGRAAFDLSRGASLRIDRATELTLASFDRVELQAGTLYVDSGLGIQTTPLEVLTEFGTVRDIGTQFEVRTSDAGLRIRVREGLVQLDQNGPTSDLAWRAGEQVMISSFGELEQSSIARDGAEWQWAETLAGSQVIVGKSAFEVLSWVARETGMDLRFEDSGTELRARNETLGGSNQALTPDEALAVLRGTTLELDIQIDNGVMLIRRR